MMHSNEIIAQGASHNSDIDVLIVRICLKGIQKRGHIGGNCNCYDFID